MDLSIADGTLPGCDSRECALLFRLGEDGSFIDGARLNVSGRSDGFRGVAALPGGDVVAVGWANVGDVGIRADQSLLAARLRSDGATVWTATFGSPGEIGANFPVEFATSVAVSPDGSLFVGGGVQGPVAGAMGVPADSPSALLMELDADTGDVVWSRTYGGAGSVSLTDLLVTPTALYAVLSATGATGDRLDLGTGETYALGAPVGFVLAVSPTDGSVLHVWEFDAANSAEITNLAVSGDELLATGRTWERQSDGRELDTRAHLWVLSPDLSETREITNLLGGGLEIATGVYSSIGEPILIGSAAWLGESGQYEVEGRTLGTDIFAWGYDAVGRVRWRKLDGDVAGYETVRARAFGSRVFVFGSYDNGFRFEGLSLPRDTGGVGFLLSMTVAE